MPEHISYLAPGAAGLCEVPSHPPPRAVLSGFFGGLRRVILRGRLRDGMRKNLADVVRKLESSCAVKRATPS
jgi:hypothetical protein